MNDRYDVIIIGAGAAGLAAAHDLSGAGKKICILEGRSRIGGRIWTIHKPGLPLPIELGAEFVHGEAPQTFSIIEAAALLACELPDSHWWSNRGKWELRTDFWEMMGRLFARIPSAAHDISFVDFLKRQRRLSPRLRQMAMMFVEGYEASHADRISAASLRADVEDQTHRQFRIANGYDALMEWLRARLDPSRTMLLLGSAVTNIEWRRGEVEVHTARGHSFRATAAIITIPLGVWKAPAGIRFQPPLRQKQKAIDKLEVGHVVKIVFRFRERFWDTPDFVRKRAARKRRPEEVPLNFVHSSDRFMPTWWTTAPVRSPLLTGWSAGHAADALLAEGESAIADRALDSLGSIFAVKRRELDRLLDSAHTHDWQADPFSRGAYSYTGIGGASAHAALARPVAGTLFFAGEATSSDETGTVAGAIATGRRAAREVLKLGSQNARG